MSYDPCLAPIVGPEAFDLNEKSDRSFKGRSESRGLYVGDGHSAVETKKGFSTSVFLDESFSQVFRSCL